MDDDVRKTPASDRANRDAYEREVTTDLDDETPDAPKGMALHTRILLGLAIGAVAGIMASGLFGADHPRLVWVVE
ncbi:MAG: hypothetical protein ACREKM_00145, partial [Longimicrobiales bacterium]